PSLLDALPISRGRHRARRQRGRSVLVAILAVCVLAGALLWAGVLPPGASKENATATPERPSNTQEGLAAAVRDLVAARDDALQTGDGQALAALTAPDSPLGTPIPGCSGSCSRQRSHWGTTAPRSPRSTSSSAGTGTLRSSWYCSSWHITAALRPRNIASRPRTRTACCCSCSAHHSVGWP